MQYRGPSGWGSYRPARSAQSPRTPDRNSGTKIDFFSIFPPFRLMVMNSSHAPAAASQPRQAEKPPRIRSECQFHALGKSGFVHIDVIDLSPPQERRLVAEKLCDLRGVRKIPDADERFAALTPHPQLHDPELFRERQGIAVFPRHGGERRIGRGT